MIMADRIAQILYSGLGGHGNVAFSLVHAARKAGDTANSAMIFVGIEPVLPSYQAQCTSLAVPYRSIRAVRGLPILRWFMLLWHLIRLRPNIILLHSVKMILPAKLYAVISGAHLVAIEHQANDLKKPSEWAVSRLVMRCADKVILLTDDYAAALKAGMGPRWRDDKVVIIPNGIDTDLFRPRKKTAITNNTIRIGMASRLAHNKRHDTLIDGFATLCRDHSDKNWHLTIAGDGETRQLIDDKIRALNLSNNVTLEGFLGPDELTTWFQGIDVYVHASDGETLSTSLLQALAMALPIVGSNVPGINNLLAMNAGCGIVAKEQSAEAFADALYEAAQDTPQTRAMGARARDLALSTYSQDAMFGRYRGVIDSL